MYKYSALTRTIVVAHTNEFRLWVEHMEELNGSLVYQMPLNISKMERIRFTRRLVGTLEK